VRLELVGMGRDELPRDRSDRALSEHHREQVRRVLAADLATAVLVDLGRVARIGEVAEGGPVTALVERAGRAGLAVFELGPGIMERVADTVSPQSVCAVVEAVDLGLDELLSRSGPSPERGVVLVCVDVRDPGNLGAVLRIAGATGVSGVICCEGTVDPFNPKVVRASAGALFKVPLVTDVMPGDALGSLATVGYRCWATVPRGGTDYEVANLDGPTALVLGNEGAGLPAEVVKRLDGSLTIPMADGTESLNVAMTAAVLCFDAVRRRRTAG